jgi:glycosyltransferase involved in cell wall biosynthesis
VALLGEALAARSLPESSVGGRRAMKLLCVGNGAIAKRGSARLINRNSADFYEELAERHPGVVLANGMVDFGGLDTLGDKDLSAVAGLEVDGFPWDAGALPARLWNYVRALPWVLPHVRRADFVYIFLPGRLPLIFALAARLLGRPYAVYLRGEISERECRLGLPAARFVLAVNEGMRDIAARHCPNTGLIRPMIEYGLEDLVHERPARREGPWRLLFVGRVEEKKGVADLIDAAGLLKQSGLELELELVGGGISEAAVEALRERARAAGFPASSFRGVATDRETLAECYRRADLLVLPTHSDGFPRVLFEAMVFGVPVLTTFVGGIPAALHDGVDCLRLPLRDPRGIADVIQGALADPERRARIGAAGTQLIERTLQSRTLTHVELFDRKLGEFLAERSG